MRRLRVVLAAVATGVLTAAATVVLSTPASAASLVEVTNFGSNPGGMRMHVYVPDNRPASPGVVVAMHGCGGSGPGFFSGSEFAALADRHGFIVIYPTATQQAGFGNCFDVWSDAAKRRGGGSDPVSIISMVTYAQRQYGGDPNRVYATGSSSGGMMTNHMLALYPDVFKGGAAFMGVPFGCFANAADFPPPNSRCTGNGGANANRTPQQWGDLVRQANPGYSGPRPPIQLWHGTNDTLVPFALLQEAVDQWTNVLGLSLTPTSTDSPQPTWSRRRWTSGSTARLEAIAVSGAGHSLPMSGMAARAITFFGLDGSTPNPPPPPPPAPNPPPPPPPAPNPPPPPPPAPNPPPPVACRITYAANAWSNGFTADVTVANTGSTPVNGWTVQWAWPGNQQVTGGWNATVTQTGNAVTARNAAWNPGIAPGTSQSFGLQATYSGTNSPPTQFTLNGAVCTS